MMEMNNHKGRKLLFSVAISLELFIVNLVLSYIIVFEFMDLTDLYSKYRWMLLISALFTVSSVLTISIAIVVLRSLKQTTLFNM